MERAIVQKKAAAVDTLAEKLKKAATVITFDYPGLTVDQFTDLRAKLREEGCEVTVYKNNISRRASIAAGYEDLADSFVGAKALIISYDDVVAPAKIIADFAKEYKAINIEAGVIEGDVVGKEEIIELASLPSVETLLTQLAVGLLTPVRELAIGLNMISSEEEN